MCWLCKFNTHRDAMDMNQFIYDNIASMSQDALVSEVLNEMRTRQPSVHEITADTIRDHIQTHTLNPTIRIGLTLRNMLDLSDKVRSHLDKVDANGQNMGLDPKMLDSYIRLQNQILNMYKSEPNKMVFNTHSGGSI